MRVNDALVGQKLLDNDVWLDFLCLRSMASILAYLRDSLDDSAIQKQNIITYQQLLEITLTHQSTNKDQKQIIIIKNMKPNKFKIRVFQSHNKNHPPNFDSQASEDGAINRDNRNDYVQPNANQELNNIFRHILVSLQKLNSSILTKRQDLQVRDRSYLLQLPTGSSFKKRRQLLKKWVDKMINDIVSIAFNYYCNEQLTYEQTKIFCSENILSNIAALVDQYDLNGAQLKEIDEFIRDDVLDLLLKKYPMTQSIVVNRALQAVAKAPDLSNKLQNDFFTINKHIFESKTDYSRQIKLMINSIIKVANQKNIVLQQLSNFELFKRCMGKIFEMVEDIDWMESSENERSGNFLQQLRNNKKKIKQAVSQQNHNRRRQYKEKVKHYTSYLIGRKVSQNMAPFSEEEIQSKGIQVKNTAILRILTKWCEQLWQKFMPKNYYMNKTQDFMLISGQTKTLSAEMRSQLDKLMQLEKAEIRLFMSKLTNDNYQAQINLLNQLLQNIQDEFRQKNLEKVSEKFSVLIGKSLEKWVVKYLNRLIQGLSTVAQDFHLKYMSNDWPSPPNLVTFKIGDLMRCKCSSGETEILYIFKQIKWLSDNNPQLLSITRIKNRLSLGTNDILMNIKFGGSTICQIQLAVNSNKSKFLKASNGMSHYLYELQRSLFGPINELGCIWRNLDLRASYFDKTASGGKNSGSHRCELLKRSFEFQVFEGPFICNICNSTYSENQLLVKHVKCSECSFWKCAHCQIKLATCEDLANMFVSDVIIRKMCEKKVQIDEENKDLPQFGVAINLRSQKYSSLIIFKKIEVRGINYLFTRQEGNIKLILKLTQEGAEQTFIKEHIVFQLNDQNGSSLLDLTLNQVNQQYFLPNHIAECYRHQKKSISLQNQPLNQQNCFSTFDGKKSDQLAITSLSLVNTDITNIWPLDQLFPNVQQLCLSRNKRLSSFETLFYFFKMRSLTMREVGPFKQIPKQICSLKTLIKLDLKDCQFQEIPSCIGELKQLKVLDISHRQGREWQIRIRQIPIQLYSLSNLEELNLSYQGIRLIHQQIGKLKNLKYLNLRHNEFSLLPQTINNLTLLEFIDFRENPIEELPKSVAGLANLKEFRLQKLGQYTMKLFGQDVYKNKFSSLPQDLQQIEQLKCIDVHSQNLNYLPPLEKCKNIEEINVFRCSLLAAPQLSNCVSLKRLSLKQQMNSDKDEYMVAIDGYLFKQTPNLLYFCASYNSIKAIPQSIKHLVHLQELDLCRNQIEQVCEEIGQCKSLININLYSNKIKRIPTSMRNLQQLQFLSLSENQLHEVTDSLSDCVALRELYLNKNRIEQFGDGMGKLVKLEVLDLQQNLIEVLPKSLNNLKKMAQGKFIFYFNPLYSVQCLQLVKKADSRSRSLSDQIKSGFFQASFSQIKLQRISERIGKATHIKSINLSGQQFKQLPQQFASLSNLQVLNLGENRFELFPLPVARCLNLKQLNIENNSIAEIPKQVGNLVNLQMLDLSKNNLTQVNEAINECIRLKKACFNQNKISHINDEVFATLQNLQFFSITSNELTQIPKGITKCLNLTQLYLAENKIQALNCNFEPNNKIQTVNLFRNELTLFPEQLLDCPNLEYLILDSNKITNISQRLYTLSNLKTLSMNANKIHEIPKTIGLAKSLRSLNLPNNQIQVLVRQLSELSSLDRSMFNIFHNPIKRVECRQWIMEYGNAETKKIAMALTE